jgi:hypothetical protein
MIWDEYMSATYKNAFASFALVRRRLCARQSVTLNKLSFQSANLLRTACDGATGGGRTEQVTAIRVRKAA